MTTTSIRNIAVLTSGGDAQGMNAAIRSVVRTALHRELQVFAVYEGYQGLVDGGNCIRLIGWDDVGGILQQGGTVIGSARCQAFRTREGRLAAAHNLLRHEINALVVIGGDGSLTGANLFRQDWPDLVAELRAQGKISAEVAARFPQLAIVGLVGSIDNDMFGTDMTIGADTALHRITEAIDAIASTAASHQRTFVVEVMGRHCGYLALMSAIATGAEWVLIPESPPDVDDWEAEMCAALQAGREAGHRDSIVIVAEGAQDRYGNPISCAYVKQVLEERLGEDTRITILGHVQRGGAPSAFDRILATLQGHAAVETLIKAVPEDEPQLIGIRENRITYAPLMDCVHKTRAVAEVIAQHNYEEAMGMRGGSFKEALRTLRTLVRAFPRPPKPGQQRLRLAILHAGAPAAGMNAAVRAAVRLGLDRGHIMLGVRHGFRGLLKGQIEEMTWLTVNGWTGRGGVELGTNRFVPNATHLPQIAEQLEQHQVQGLLVIGGWAAYEAAYALRQARIQHAAFNIPIICLPATIDNDLPGSEISIGADTALNNIVEAMDKIKQSAVATRRCFVVEVMGRYCGYLALMSGLAAGAERIYLHEEGVTLHDLQADLNYLVDGFRQGKRLGLLVRNERANNFYTTNFMCSLFEQEGGDLFDVRQAILGHLQQGGDPSPFDRIQATRLARRCLDFLLEEAPKPAPAAAMIGLQTGQVSLTGLDSFPVLADPELQRPKDQWWLNLRPIARLLAKSEPHKEAPGS